VHLNDEAEDSYGGLIGFDKLMAFPVLWSGVRTKEDVLNQIQAIMERYKFQPGEWIYFASKGSGMTPEGAQIMMTGLTRWDLDKVTPNNPIAMGMNWPNVNGLLVNSKAIDELWANHADFLRKYGRYWIDSSGRPDGHLESPANRFVWELLPKPRPEDLGPIFKLYSEELNAQGITGISVQLPNYAIAPVQWLESRGEWSNLRFGYGMASEFGNIEVLGNNPRLKELGEQMNKGSEMFWVVSASPTAMDGSGSRVCSGQTKQSTVGDVDEWYPIGQCSMDGEYNGGGTSAKVSGNYFREWLEAGARNGFRLANVHVAGDRTVKLTINLMEELQRQVGPAAARGWAIDHCRMVDPADIPRAAKVGLNFSCAASLGSTSEAEAYGEKVAENFPSPVKTMLSNGVNVSVDSGSFETLETFVTRKDRTGKVWAPHERLSRVEALRVFTQNGANYMLRGDKFGSLETGKFADLVVLDKDYMTVPEEDLSTIEPQMTMVGGKVVWAQPAFVAESSLARAPGMVVGTLKDLEARRKPSGVTRR
jgi:predicted amidohydrolase YtcJ